MGDRRQHKGVRGTEQLCQPVLDIDVDAWVAQQPRPARVGAPTRHLGRDRVHDLWLEVEAEVVAGGEVRQPRIADADSAAVDLLDDGVVEAALRPQPFQIAPSGIAPQRIRAG